MDTASNRSAALQQLLCYLAANGYGFVAPTPATHARYLKGRGGELARDTRDVLGWSMAFCSGQIDPVVEELLYRAGALVGAAHERRSTLRVSTLHNLLFLHSAYPTSDADSVFFGPDSYRFANLVRTELSEVKGAPVIADIGTGAGVGGIVAHRAVPASTVIMTDINAAAIGLAEVNAEFAQVSAKVYCGDLLAGYSGTVDIALANPPYILDAAGRVYRDGGSGHGAELSIRMTSEVLPRLNQGGRFILYSGSAIVEGRDAMRTRLAAIANTNACVFAYRELDPDVFGEELALPNYGGVERIAAIAALFRR